MMANRSSNGRNADFIALIVDQRSSSMVQPASSTSSCISRLADVPLMSRLSVLTVTRNRWRFSRVMGWSAIEAAAPVPHVGGQPAQPDFLEVRRQRRRRIGHEWTAVDLDVIDDAHAVPEPVRAAPLDRLPDARQPERLSGMDGEVRVLPAEVLE